MGVETDVDGMNSTFIMMRWHEAVAVVVLVLEAEAMARSCRVIQTLGLIRSRSRYILDLSRIDHLKL